MKVKDTLKNSYQGERASKDVVEKRCRDAASVLFENKKLSMGSKRRSFLWSLIGGISAAIAAIFLFLPKKDSLEVLQTTEIKKALDDPEFESFEERHDSQAELLVRMDMIYYLEILKKWKG